MSVVGHGGAGGAGRGARRGAERGRAARALAALPVGVLGARRLRPGHAHVPLRRLLDAEPAHAGAARRAARLRYCAFML